MVRKTKISKKIMTNIAARIFLPQKNTGDQMIFKSNCIPKKKYPEVLFLAFWTM
jgi:hypothetical protein